MKLRSDEPSAPLSLRTARGYTIRAAMRYAASAGARWEQFCEFRYRLVSGPPQFLFLKGGSAAARIFGTGRHEGTEPVSAAPGGLTFYRKLMALCVAHSKEMKRAFPVSMRARIGITLEGLRERRLERIGLAEAHATI